MNMRLSATVQCTYTALMKVFVIFVLQPFTVPCMMEGLSEARIFSTSFVNGNREFLIHEYTSMKE